MSDAANKSTPGTAAAGNSNFFRRKKIIPAVVARKIGNSSTSKSNKTAGTTTVKPMPANVSKNSEESNSTDSMVPAAPVAISAVVEGTMQEQRLQEEEVSKSITAPEESKKDANSNPPAPSKPATAFRRIKPKVAILPQLKPAKSILKKTNTPSQEPSSSSSPESTVANAAENEEKRALLDPESEPVAEKDDTRQEEDKDETLTNIPNTSSQVTSHSTHSIVTSEKPEEPKHSVEVVDETNVLQHSVQSVQSETNENETDAKNVSQTANVVICDIKEQTAQQENSSVLEATNSTIVAIDNAPQASTPTLQDVSKQSISQTALSSTPVAATVGTKTIKRAIPLGKLSADLTNLLKNHIKKKGKTIPAKGNGKEVATPKPSPIANQRTDSLSKESQENQENQKQIVNSSNVPPPPSAPSQCPAKDQTLLDVEPSKACSELDAVPAVLDYSATKALQTPNELSVLESRPDNVLNQQNMVPKIAPAPAKPPAAPPEASSPVAGGQTSGVKKIQKVHKLTDETKLLLMNSLKKGKAKGSAKTASAKSNVTVAAPSQTMVESVSVLPSVPPVVLKKATPTKDECKVNIISSVVLPRLFNVPGQSGQPIPNVSSFGTTHQHSYTFPDSSAVISIPSASSSLAVTQSLGQPICTTADSSSQYPKVFIIGHDVNSTFATVPSTVPLPPSVVSVTVLPQPNPVCFANIPSTPSRPICLPPPIVTIRPTLSQNVPYASTAPPRLPTPIVSVTLTPAHGSNSAEASRMDVPVDPRIVPKIVIQGCDSVDPDSQSSLSSTSSSSSSVGQNSGAKNRHPSAGREKKQPDTGKGGCSPTTLSMLRAKMLQNIKQKAENNLPRDEPVPSEIMPRQYGNYGKQPNIISSKSHHDSVPEIPTTITVEPSKSCTAEKEQVPDTLNNNYFTTASNDPPQVAPKLETKDTHDDQLSKVDKSNDACDEVRLASANRCNLETNGFYGFSNASIDNAERDFVDRARTIDAMLQSIEKSSADEPPDEVEQCVPTDDSDQLAQSLPATMSEYPKTVVRNTFTNILTTCSETREPDTTVSDDNVSPVANVKSEAAETSSIAVPVVKKENVPASVGAAPVNTATEESVVDEQCSDQEDHQCQDSAEESQPGGSDNECVEEIEPPATVSHSNIVEFEAERRSNDQFVEAAEAIERDDIIKNSETSNIVRDDSKLLPIETIQEPKDKSPSVPDILISVIEPIQQPTDEPKLVSPEKTEESKDVSHSVVVEEALPTSPPEVISNPVAAIEAPPVNTDQVSDEPKSISPEKTQESKDASQSVIVEEELPTSPPEDTSNSILALEAPPERTDQEPDEPTLVSPEKTEEPKHVSHSLLADEEFPIPTSEDTSNSVVAVEAPSERTDQVPDESKLLSPEKAEVPKASHVVVAVEEPLVPPPELPNPVPDEPKLAPLPIEPEKQNDETLPVVEEQTIPPPELTDQVPDEPILAPPPIEPEKPKDEPHPIVEEAPIPVPEPATGVDLIIAMARMRRENRVMSVDTASVEEEFDRMEEELSVASVTPTKPTSTSGGRKQKQKPKRKKRKRRRDELVELLLKHVNYESLIEDLLQQEKQRLNYVSSSSTESDEERSLSPLERYIRGQERERRQQNEENIVVESDDCTTTSYESLVEEKILSIFCNKDGSTVQNDRPIVQQKARSSGCSTSMRAVLADLEKERSDICDRMADEAAVEIKESESLLDSDNDVKQCSDELSVAPAVACTGVIDGEIKREHDKTCDKIDTAKETPVKLLDVSIACVNTGTCDNATSNAVVEREPASSSISPMVETINTPMNKVTEGPVKGNAKKRAAKRPAAGRRMPQKRAKLITPPMVEMPLFDSSDAPNNEVVSDCSTDGLSSTVDAAVVNREKPSKTTNGSGGAGNDTNHGVEGKDEISKPEQKMKASVKEKHDTLQRPSRSRKSGGRNSSSSSSSSSSNRSKSNNSSSRNRINTASDGDDLSSSGEPKTVKRRRLRRKKRSSLRVRSNLAQKSAAIAVDCSTDDPSVSSTARGGSSHLSFTASSKHSKASSAAAAPTFAIPEISASEEEIVTPRPRQMIRVRNSRALLASPPPEEPVKQGRKRGRGRGAATKQSPANGNESIVAEHTHLELDPENPLVKCGHCGTSIVPDVWQEHYNFHNGATYRVGIDQPFDLQDVKAMSAVIQRFMKVQRRAEVACERCGEVKKSGTGMASHLQTCGKSKDELEQSKTACEHCGRKMKAVSITVHQLQHCKVLKLKQQQQQQQQESQAAEHTADNTTTPSGRMKRKSVTTAERLIKKLTKEINEEAGGDELVRKISGDGLTEFIMKCWLTHLQQSKEGVCPKKGCAFFGMTAECMRWEHSYQEDGRDPKPAYQCVKCGHMTVNQSTVYDHIRLVHPDLVRKAAQQQHTGIFGSDGDSDAYVASGNGSASDDTYSSGVLDAEDEELGGGKAKKGKGGKKQSGTAGANKSKSKKGADSSGGKKGAAKQQTGGASKANTSELLDSSMTAAAGEETEVYKEMVFQESVDFKADKANYYLMSVKWTHEFRRDHYTARLLFSELRPDVDTSFFRSLHDLHNYLPNTARSMRYVQCNSKVYDPGYTAEPFKNRWQQMGTFEGEALGCEQLFFTGGPVVSLDWLPLPDGVPPDADQFLAIACKQTYDEYYSCEELAVPQPRKCLVQIWNVGPLQNPSLSKITARNPRLAFAIPCDYGPIWQIAFCPSGCYNDPAQGDDFDRLGLLAVAGSDGDVHLYALSRSMAETPEDTKPGTPPRVLPLRPVMLLSLSFTTPPTHDGPAADFTGRSVLRIAWSREKGHNVLAAGYSNGVVAVWNLAAKSTLLCGTKEGIRTLLPVHRILHSSSSCITALDLHYSSGTRFLVVCNADRRLKVYDLRCGLYQPLESLSTIVRSRMPALRWMLHFPVLVIAYDDALCIDRCAYTVHQPREIGLRMFGIFTLGAEMTDLGMNDWLSMNAVSTSGGDLVCHRPVPFVFGMNYKKMAQVLTTTISMKLKPENDSADVSRYDAFSEEYGLLFSDTDKVPTAMDTASLHLKTWRRGKLGHYPAVRLNQIRWNPNTTSYAYYAIGYQAGFVRVRVLRT
ncbi:uncharacterized protein LOC133393735 isoform X1 [Anopheles gambiae]|uniref:uncharacterized protein LOC133393735 isoform X1 n=1 Tax=Anopheles gambiae TaxID=7165 RepID=UPI002AC9A0C9|nr:uncharacterized protein LOC133393735 isoform X1 [Anopheles gambiae]